MVVGVENWWKISSGKNTSATLYIKSPQMDALGSKSGFRPERSATSCA